MLGERTQSAAGGIASALRRRNVQRLRDAVSSCQDIAQEGKWNACGKRNGATPRRFAYPRAPRLRVKVATVTEIPSHWLRLP